MIIEIEGDENQFRLPKMDEPVSVNDEGRARVPAHVGEYLAERLQGVTIIKDERSGDSQDEPDTDSTEDSE